MRKSIFFMIIVLFTVMVKAQYVTPGTGQEYNLDLLSTISSGAVIKESNGNYSIKSNLHIAASDSLIIDTDSVVVKIDPNVLITISGYFETNSISSELTSSNILQPYNGFLFESGSKAKLLNAKFSYGGGLKFKTKDIIIDNCEFYKNLSGINTAAAVELDLNATPSSIVSLPTVKNSRFIENVNSGFSSLGSVDNSYLQFINNYVYKNGKSTKAQVEIDGASSVSSDSTRIKNNQILGNRSFLDVGGMHIVSRGAPIVVTGNLIKDNAYGVRINMMPSGTVTNYVYNNIIEDNNINSIGNYGAGFHIIGILPGVAVGKSILYKNQIRNNLIGVHSEYFAIVDLGGGLPGSIGGNIFYNNKKGNDTIALYVGYKGLLPDAKFNCWREGELSDDSMVVDVIKTYGNVFSDNNILNAVAPYDCGLVTLETHEIDRSNTISLYPNPNKGIFFIHADTDDVVVIFDNLGRRLFTDKIKKGENKLDVNLKTGIYFIQFINAKKSGKLFIN